MLWSIKYRGAVRSVFLAAVCWAACSPRPGSESQLQPPRVDVIFPSEHLAVSDFAAEVRITATTLSPDCSGDACLVGDAIPGEVVRSYWGGQGRQYFLFTDSRGLHVLRLFSEGEDVTLFLVGHTLMTGDGGAHAVIDVQLSPEGYFWLGGIEEPDGRVVSGRCMASSIGQFPADGGLVGSDGKTMRQAFSDQTICVASLADTRGELLMWLDGGHGP